MIVAFLILHGRRICSGEHIFWLYHEKFTSFSFRALAPHRLVLYTQGMDFVLVNRGKPVGPLSAERIREAINSGEITRNAKIWRPPWANWAEAETVFPIDFGLTADFISELEEKGEIRHSAEESLFERVQRQVPASQIEAILRRAKGVSENPRDILIGSRNKKELVYRNLQQAISKGYVAKQEVEKLVREMMETGGQRIFLYRLKEHIKNSSVRLSLNEVGIELLGKDWAKNSFPIFHHLPATPQISSLRAYVLEEQRRENPYGFDASRASGWILTIDASMKVDERIDRENASSGDIIVRTYASKLEDAVVVMRYWEQLQLVELRIPNFEKRAMVVDLRDTVWSTFGEKLGLDQKFEPWVLATACTKALKSVLNAPKIEPTLRRISGTFLREKDRSTMKIEIENSEEEGIIDSSARKESVQAYLRQASTVESIVAYYQPAGEKDEIRVVIAAECPYEISVRKSIVGWHLDHVIFRLYSNSERAS